MATAFTMEERERIKERLLDAALRCASGMGMRHTTVDGLARQAGIKMTFPLVFLVFPALFVVILAVGLQSALIFLTYALIFSSGTVARGFARYAHRGFTKCALTIEPAFTDDGQRGIAKMAVGV